ncbi:hypothetical protein R6Q59_014245 [Mikania micrantha]
MLRRKPTKIEIKIQDKEELEEARNRTAAVNPTGATALLHHFNTSSASASASTKAQRIGLQS